MPNHANAMPGCSHSAEEQNRIKDFLLNYDQPLFLFAPTNLTIAACVRRRLLTSPTYFLPPE